MNNADKAGLAFLALIMVGLVGCVAYYTTKVLQFDYKQFENQKVEVTYEQ